MKRRQWIATIMTALALGGMQTRAEEQREKYRWELGCKPDKIIQFSQPNQ